MNFNASLKIGDIPYFYSMQKAALLLTFMCLIVQTPLHAQIKFEGKELINLPDGHQLIRYVLPEAGSLQGRYVDVWLPRNVSPDQKLGVVYAHDGQNLFDPQSAYGGETWDLHQTAQQLIDNGQLAPFMIVGIWNSSARFEEYLPTPAFTGLSAAKRTQLQKERSGQPKSDEYLRWLVTELKPFIDQQFPTFSEPKHTVIMGSSMGGLISAYALAKHPDVFGGAGCLSTHWPLSLKVNDVSNSLPYRQYLANNLPKDGQHRLWMDHGTTTLDAWYEPHQKAFDAVIKKVPAWQSAKNYQSKKYPGAPHNEVAWRERAAEVLFFLMTP